jgi:membrane protease YdiL (CAAX protease family)
MEKVKKTELVKKVKGWGPTGSFTIVLVTYIAANIVADVILNIYAITKHWNSAQSTNWLNNSAIGQFWLTLAIEVAFIFFIYLFLKIKKTNFKSIGLKGRPAIMDLGRVLIGYGAYIITYLLAIFLVEQFIKSVNVNQKQNIGFNTSDHGPVLILIFISLVILPPIAEEIVFRGFLYTGLKRNFNKLENFIFLRKPIKVFKKDHFSKIAAALVTSAFFASFHLLESTGGGLLWVAGIDTFLLSLVLVYLRETTGKLWASMGLHMLKNLIAFAALFIFPYIR